MNILAKWMSSSDYQYKGFTCSVDEDCETGGYKAEVVLSQGIVGFSADTADEIRRIFHRMIDDLTMES